MKEKSHKHTDCTMAVDELLRTEAEALRSNLIYYPVSHMEILTKFTAGKDGTTFAN
jgi:hypothetical protein